MGQLDADAQWGRLTVDDLAIDWTAADRERLEVMAGLRDRRFSETALAEYGVGSTGSPAQQSGSRG
ncbi:hypothetical protein AB4Z09_27025 [Rhodococcus sp. TAF43]|uniref:hypothetical protein n=1 Tax=Rhodococcus sp. TAF43 TaxID=3237483 RepID=UPI003F9588C9